MAYRIAELRGEPPLLTRQRAWSVAIVATLVMSVSYVDRQTLAALSPTVIVDLGLSHTQYGWLTSAFSIAYLVCAPFAGELVDRVGARVGLVVAVLAWSMVSALHALAPSFVVLFALRIVLGATESPSFPGAAQAVRRALPAEDRSAGFGLLFTGSSIGAMVAAPLAIALATRFGWRFAFLGTALFGLLWLPGWLACTHGAHVRRALATGVFGAPGATWEKPRSAWSLLADAPVLRGVVLVVASAPAVSFVYNWLPQYLVSAHHLTQAVLGHYVWTPPLFFDLGAVGFGVGASFRERRAARPDGGQASPVQSQMGLMLIAAVASGALALVPFASGPWGAVLLAGVSMAGGGGLFALLTGDMLARVDPARVSSAGGLTAAAQSLAYVVVNPLVGVAVDKTHSYTLVLFVIGACALPGAAIWCAWRVPTELQRSRS